MDQQQIATLLGIGENAIFTIGDMFFSMIVTTLLIMVLTKVYKDTHSGPNYSKTFITTLFIMSVATSVVMLIIGSNIARAFSLIGALSIIRFRTAVKDPRDTAYLFAGVVAGMGCGTGFYVPSVFLTFFLTVLLYLLDLLEYGTKTNVTSILKVNSNTEADINNYVLANLKKANLINKINDFSSSSVTHVYSFSPTKKQSIEDLERDLSGQKGINNVSIYQADQHAPF